MKTPSLVITKRIKTKIVHGVVGWNADVMRLNREYNDLEMKIDRMKIRQKAILRKLKLLA